MTDQAVRRAVLALLLLVTPVAAGAEIIDRVFAVVDGALITQSDVLGAIRVGTVIVQAAPDPVSAVLDSLIERRLILAEVDRYAPPDPAEADVARAFEGVRTRVGPGPLESALSQTGSSADQLRRFLRDDLRIQAYLQQRFGTIQPAESDVAQYYRDHPAEFGQRSLAEVHDMVVAALTMERRAAVIKEWVAGLRRRANINILPR